MGKLNLGCGAKALEGYINADIRLIPTIDIVCDFDKCPYPFKDNSFDEILCDNVLEHLDDIVSVMEELHRIGKPGCRIIILTPHFSNQYAFTDPTHKHYFAYQSFDYFLKDGPDAFPKYSSKAKFELISRRIVFSKGIILFVNYFMEWLANKIPQYYEGTVLRAFPAEHLKFILKVPEKDTGHLSQI